MVSRDSVTLDLMPFASSVPVLWTLLLGAVMVACTTYEQGYEFEPTATWGSHSNFGGCPHASPSIRIVPKNAGLRIHVGMWNSLQARNRRYADPTVFIYIYKVGPWFLEGSPAAKKELAATPVRIRTSSSQLKVSLADGRTLTIDLPQLRGETTLVGMDGVQPAALRIDVPLRGVTMQDMTVSFPDFYVDGVKYAAGVVHFAFKEQQMLVPC